MITIESIMKYEKTLNKLIEYTYQRINYFCVVNKS